MDEEQKLLEHFREYQQKLAQAEELKARKAEIERLWEESQRQAKLEEENRIKAQIEALEREKANAIAAQARARSALDREQETRRIQMAELERKQLIKRKVEQEEKMRSEAAVKAFQEKVKAAAEAPKEPAKDDKVHCIGGKRKRFNAKDFEHTTSHCVVVRAEDEDDESEDANARAIRVREEQADHKVQVALAKQEAEERAKSREKVAIVKMKLEKDLSDLEKKAKAEKVKMAQLQLQAVIQGEQVRLDGMRHQEHEKKFEQKRQDKLIKEFEKMFFGKVDRERTEGHEHHLGDKIELIAFWKDPGEIYYEAKKTMEWGPKNKKREFNVPDIDKIVNDRKEFRSRSTSKDKPAQPDQTKPAREDSMQNHHLTSDNIHSSSNGNFRKTLSNKAGSGGDEVSFNYTEVEDRESTVPLYPFGKSELLQKYKSRDGGDSPTRQTVRPHEETLEMTVSEETDGGNFRRTHHSTDPTLNLGLADIGRYIEEQQRVLERLEKDRLEIKKKLIAEEQEADIDPDAPDEESQERRPVRRGRAPQEDHEYEGEGEEEADDQEAWDNQDIDDSVEEEEEEEVERPRPKQTKKSSETLPQKMNSPGSGENGTLSGFTPIEEQTLLSKFLTFKPDSKCNFILTKGIY